MSYACFVLVVARWDMRLFSDDFSLVVKQLREDRKLSRAALAKKANLHQTYIGLLERGERSPNLDTAKAIANALGISLAEMIAQAEKQSPVPDASE
jgi:transcriptional regulator with XRE-family HTH domain